MRCHFFQTVGILDVRLSCREPQSVATFDETARSLTAHLPAPVAVTVRASLTLAALLLPVCVSAQPAQPVILVHGLDSSEATWRASVVRLQDLGYGTPYSYHADLNASTLTLAEADVVGPVVTPYWDFVSPTAAAADSAGIDGAVAALSAQRASGLTNSRLFAVNFNTWYDAATNTIVVHGDRNLSGHSESNCAAIAKQGLALARVVADVLDWTGADRVTLVGHSMGGLAIREYLQRRTADGRPRWWVEPEASGGHRVAAVVTTGTPHQGSNTVNFGLIGCPDSEATRDLRYSYLSTGEVAPYLYGGSEQIQAYWHNRDVDADGSETGTVVGLNAGDPFSPYAPDNPAMPLPTDVAYTYIYSATDGVVSAPRQLVQFLGSDGNPYLSPVGSARALRRDRLHTSQPGDAETIASAVQNAVWTTTAADDAPAEVAAEVTVSPNPARGRASVNLSLRTPADARLVVVDALGRVVLRQDLGTRPAGTTRTDLDLSALAPGVYVLRAGSGEQSGRPVVFSVVR